MKIIIVGCGRVGSALALRFLKQGHTVAVIDKERAAFMRLGEGFRGLTVVGLGFDEDILKRAGIESADAFIAITGGDNSNLMAAQIAREKFRIRRVIARVKDPLRAEVYREMGLDTYCSTLMSAGLLEDALLGQPWRSIEEYLAVARPAPTDSEGGA